MIGLKLSIILLLFNFSLIFVAASGSTAKPSIKDKIKKAKGNLEKNLYNVKNLHDLANLGVLIQKGPSSIIGRSGLGSQPGDLKDATPGKCDPKPVCISNPLTLNLNSNQLPFPQCINIHRCEGCCPTNEKCVPIKSHEVKLQKVGIINIDDENNLKYSESLVSVTNHTECQCQCQWDSDEECKKINTNFVKSPYSCECVCPEEIICGAYHEFDRDSCVCKCRKDKFARMEQTCKTRGFVWNDTACRCDQVKQSMSAKEVIRN